MGTGEYNDGDNPAIHYYPILGGVELLPVAPFNSNWGKLRPHWPLNLHVGFCGMNTLTKSRGSRPLFYGKILRLYFKRPYWEKNR